MSLSEPGVAPGGEPGRAGGAPLASPIRRALLIANPAARKGRSTGAVLRELGKAGVACDLETTTAPRHAGDIARQKASRYDAVFTLGGDGTAIEVIGALAETGPPVAILPGGTGNVLARSLGISLSPRRAVSQLLGGREARLDLGQLPDGRSFAIGLGVGLDEAMIAGASPLWKRRVGFLAYVWAALKAGLRLEQFDVRIEVDGKIHETRAVSVLIANLGSVLGGLITFGADILHDDGVLHVCVFSPRTVAEALRVFGRMLRGTAHLDERSFYASGRRIRLETRPPRRAEADGELLGNTPIEIVVRPGAARLLVPATAAARSGSPP